MGLRPRVSEITLGAGSAWGGAFLWLLFFQTAEIGGPTARAGGVVAGERGGRFCMSEERVQEPAPSAVTVAALARGPFFWADLTVEENLVHP